MDKLKEYRRGREDGIALAYRIVKEGGIEALERELQHRKITGIKSPLAEKDLENIVEKIKERVFDVYTILSVATLYDEFGFGEKRCQRWLNKMNEGADLISDDLATWKDYCKAIQEQIGLNLKIRWSE